jgi:hypothetical protein
MWRLIWGLDCITALVYLSFWGEQWCTLMEQKANVVLPWIDQLY